MRFATLMFVAALAAGCHAVPTGWCTKPGDVICSGDCGTIQLCKPNATSGGYDTMTLERCLFKSSCWSEDLTCSATRSSCFNELPFVCSSLGSFPDPYDCRKYHLCLDNDHIESTCGDGYGYNSMTKSCSVPLTEPLPRACTVSPVPRCWSPGQAGTLCENTSLYYICYKEDEYLRPIVFQCFNGQVFDESMFKCVDPALGSPDTAAREPNIVNGCEQIPVRVQ